ncbi:MAG: NADH-quinone oxidoreductase subunit C [Actinomycetota bacterium]|nr:NADH-quinone oxidoreductase subunit C [Actinomycetota bacterium]
MTPLSSADEGDEKQRGDPGGPPAEEITDPALAAEVDDPGASNVPSGEEAAPGEGVTAADQGPLPAAGAPGELSSDQTPAQGKEEGRTVPADDLGHVAGGDAGSPESVPGPESTEGPEDEPPGAPPVPAPKPAPEAAATDPATETEARLTSGADPAASETVAVVPEQPPATPSAVAAEGAAVQRATEEKVAQAVAVREATVVEAAEEEAERGETDHDRQGMVDTLRRVLGDAAVDAHIRPGVDAWVRVHVDAWRHAAEVCRDTLGLTYFCYLSAIDWLPSPYGRSEDPAPADAANETEVGEEASGDTGVDEAATDVTPAQLAHGVAGGETRFQLLARLVSPTTHLGLTLKADLVEPELRAPSLLEVFPGADWHEREAWEMFGIDFEGHPNLIHLYLPGGFEGHPLRKDFPLLAREVKPWPGLVDVEAMPDEVVPAEAEPGGGEGA